MKIFLTEYWTVDETGNIHRYGEQVLASSWDKAELIASNMFPKQEIIGELDEVIEWPDCPFEDWEKNDG